MNGKSLNIAEEKLDKLKDIIPEAFTENKVDWEKLKACLGDNIEFKNERYVLNWAGKSDAFRILQSPTTATLIPDRNESVDFDKTENIFIEGENLEVLKVLQKSYFGKIKMIYIDPPYNTGNDNFIYPDKFSETKEEYLSRIGDKDESGYMTREGLFRKNSKDSGHYHSNWLSMMYPRLFLARNLLKDDGVIFVSIDDNEVHNLRMLMNEVFGEENFIAQLVWNTEGHTDNQFQVKINHEYVILYSKNSSFVNLGYVIDPNTREGSNLWKGFAENSITKNGSGNPPSKIILPVGFPCKVDSIDLPESIVSEKFFSEVDKIGYITRSLTKEYNVTYPIRMDKMICTSGKLTKQCVVYSGWANANKLKDFIENGCVPIIDNEGDSFYFYLSENGVIYYKKDRKQARNILSVLRGMGTTEQMRSELESMGIYFQYPKPKQLLSYLQKIGINTKDSIVLDFFAGSATTAHAIVDLNSEDGGNRKYICVQLHEKTDEKTEAFKAGYKTIADIGKERIRRVIRKIKEEQTGELDLDVKENQDLGFKVFKLQDSNFKIWRNKIESEEQLLEQLQEHLEPLDENAKTEDVLYELLLKSGVSLTAKIEKKNGIYIINDNEIALLLEKMNEKMVKEVIELNPRKVITLDRLFNNNDQLKTNTALQMKDAEIEFKVV
ncbi:MAG: site-specific DNA-methyltransferase [Spirochaetes bacterium]|nr:site-specific DNA-methyltransferase [Spirochaetota bacterium]